VALDPKAAAIIEYMESTFPQVDTTVSGTEMRRRVAASTAQLGPAMGEQVGDVSDQLVPGPNGTIPVRMYRPEGIDTSSAPLAMFFHGGGWVLCDLDSHDTICRAIANASGCVVVAVDYRLAPEHRFPIGVEDCYAATAWMASHSSTFGVDGRRMAVVGDSAGGNLAAAVALMARDRNGPAIALQVLLYPVIDHSDQTDSHRTIGDGYFLTSREVMYYWDQYLTKSEDGDNPYASPRRAASHQHLPPALIIVPEYDPLRDEGEAYGRVLIEAGVPTTIHRVPGMFHGFLNFVTVLDAADEAKREVGAALRSALNRLE
jgi:acetyl esterase